MDSSAAQPPISAGRKGKPSAGPIRLIAVDLDGTLLTSDKKVSGQTVAALQCLPENVRVVIASARPPRSVRHIYELLGLQTLQINYNGALIWDEPTQRAAFHCPMPGELVLRMIETARDMFEEVLVSCEILDRWYTDRIDDKYTTETGKIFKPDVVAPVETFCNQPVTKLMFLGEPQVLSRIEPLLLDQFGDRISLVQTDRDLIQIMDRQVSKSTALQMVAEHYGVDRSQIMAIGDAPNDVGMLQLAGIAVAMDNASPIVKKNAHWIAPCNDDHGVHAALVRFGLCK
ncbi:MAG TPA: HAD family hydrolase [Tepidisphaeraceae bacterium]|nr:HAD family hydrolase [Tepidisphaeraceae bacterium]